MFVICVTSRGERYILRGIVVKYEDVELKHSNFLIALNDLKKTNPGTHGGGVLAFVLAGLSLTVGLGDLKGFSQP